MSMCTDRFKHSKSLLLGLGLALGWVHGVCGTVVDTQPQSPAATFSELPAAQKAARASGKSSGPMLRCWQYGRLILEETGIAMPAAEKGVKALVFPRQGSARNSVYVFDLNQGVCTITETLLPAETAPAD